MGLSIHMNKNGIKAQQLALNTISHNIANATTDAYKAQGVQFQTLMNNQITTDDVLLNGVNPSLNAGVASEVITLNIETQLPDEIAKSNVDLVQEFSNLIVTQRAYNLNIKVAQSTDEMMSLINQINQ